MFELMFALSMVYLWCTILWVAGSHAAKDAEWESALTRVEGQAITAALRPDFSPEQLRSQLVRAGQAARIPRVFAL